MDTRIPKLITEFIIDVSYKVAYPKPSKIGRFEGYRH